MPADRLPPIEHWFRVYYTYVEVLIELGTGVVALLAPAALLGQMAPDYVAHADAASAASLLMTREFGMMTLSFGILHGTMLLPWERRVVRRFVTAMLPGDLIHLAVAVAFCAANGAFNTANVFNLAFSALTIPLRAYFVLIVLADAGSALRVAGR
jgi:hypothetical protein